LKNKTIKLSKAHLKKVSEILRAYVPGCEVRAFGSRLTNQTKPYSDLDIVIVGKKRIERRVLTRLKEAFEESDLPFRVDLLDWHRISGSFKKIIEENYAPLTKRVKHF